MSGPSGSTPVDVDKGCGSSTPCSATLAYGDLGRLPSGWRRPTRLERSPPSPRSAPGSGRRLCGAVSVEVGAARRRPGPWPGGPVPAAGGTQAMPTGRAVRNWLRVTWLSLMPMILSSSRSAASLASWSSSGTSGHRRRGARVGSPCGAGSLHRAGRCPEQPDGPAPPLPIRGADTRLADRHPAARKVTELTLVRCQYAVRSTSRQPRGPHAIATSASIRNRAKEGSGPWCLLQEGSGGIGQAAAHECDATSRSIAGGARTSSITIIAAPRTPAKFPSPVRRSSSCSLEPGSAVW